MREDADVEPFHADNVGGVGSRYTRSADETRSIIWADNTDGKSADDEEEDQAVGDGVEGLGHDSSGVSGFSCRHRDVLGSGNNESSSNDASDESLESAKRSLVDVLSHRSWLSPVSEAESVTLRVSSAHGHQGVEHEYKEQHNFANSEPELCFTEEGNRPDVQAEEDEDQDRDEDGWVDVIFPEGDQSVEGCNVKAC